MSLPAWRDGRCTCCGGSVAGWSDEGRARGFRDGVEREYRVEHGTCGQCGRPCDQYGDCQHGGLDVVGGILVDHGLIDPAAAERIAHSHREHGTYADNPNL